MLCHRFRPLPRTDSVRPHDGRLTSRAEAISRLRHAQSEHGRDERAVEPSLGAPGARIDALRRERERLVTSITKKRRQLDEAVARIECTGSVLMARMPALLDRQRLLSQEIAALFAELLTPGRLNRKARRVVLETQAALEETGMLEPMPALWCVEQPGEPGDPRQAGDSTPRAGAGGRTAEPVGRPCPIDSARARLTKCRSQQDARRLTPTSWLFQST